MTGTLTAGLTIGGAELRSRLWCGHAPWLAPDWAAPYQFAAVGDAARGITAAVVLRAAIRGDGRSAPGEPVLDRDADLMQLAQLIAAVRAVGAELVVELTHGGPRCGDRAPQRPLGSRAVRDPPSGRTPQPLDDMVRERLVADFDAAGRAAVGAGARLLGLEVANGSLLHADLSPLTKAGDCADPTRSTIVRIATVLAAQAPLVVALCLEDLASGGLTPSAGIAMAVALVDAGAAALVVTAGSRHAWHLARQVRPPGPLVEGRQARLAAWTKRAVEVPVGVGGGLRSRVAIDALLTAGAMDFAVLERPFACQRDLGERLADAAGRSACSSGADCLQPLPTWRARPRSKPAARPTA